ncbi:MAG TPA: hypothetical protein VGL19_18310 [Polyangiaceae bacterium]
MLRVGVSWGSLVVVVVSLASCSGSRQSSAGGGSGGEAPELGSAGDSGAGALPELPVAEGTCGVSRSIPVLAGSLRIGHFTRTSWGFVADTSGDLGTQPAWLLVSADGAQQRTVQLAWNGTQRVLAGLPFAGSFQQLTPVFLIPLDAPGYDTRLQSSALTVPGAAAEDIGYYFNRGTTSFSSASSFDGQRGLFVSAHPVTEPPHAVLLDSSGARVGDEVVLDQDVVTCLAATPTAHAAAFSFMDSSGAAPVLQVVALGADGATSQVTVPAPSDRCPVVQSDGDALLATALVGGKVQAYSFAPGAAPVSPFFSSPPLISDLDNVGDPPTWAARSRDGGLSLYVTRDGKGQIAQVTASGAVSWLATDLPLGQVIPSAAGELFLDISAFDPTTGATAHRIDQITCNGVGF